MRESDFLRFVELLDATCSLLSRGAYKPDATQATMFFRALAAHDLATVRMAFDAHVKDPVRGRFVPLPADIVAQIAGQTETDGRPGAEVAWATAVLGADEQETIVWTAETAAAWAIAKPVFDLGDEVGARMAFKEAYARLVTEARADARLPTWSASVGFDPARRERSLKAAVSAGLLGAPEVAGLLPPPDAGAKGMPPAIRERLQALRDRLVSQAGAESFDAAAKRATAEAQDQVAQRVAEYQRGER